MPWWKKVLNIVYEILTLGKQVGLFTEKPTIPVKDMKEKPK